MRRFVQITAAVTVCVFFSVSAQANVTTKRDADTFHDLQLKLHTAITDVTQSMAGLDGRSETFKCLEPIHTEAGYVEAMATTASVLIALAAVMRDKNDESMVAYELRTFLPTLRSALISERQIINGYMGACSSITTANVKGQAVLDIFSQMNDFTSSLSGRIAPQ